MKIAAISIMPAILAGCAQQTGASAASAVPAGRECFHAGTVDDFTARGREIVDVRVAPNRYYRLQLFGICPNVDRTRAVVLRTTAGSPWICQGYDAELIVPDPAGSMRCQVSSVRRLSDAEVKAFRGR